SESKREVAPAYKPWPSSINLPAPAIGRGLVYKAMPQTEPSYGNEWLEKIEQVKFTLALAAAVDCANWIMSPLARLEPASDRFGDARRTQTGRKSRGARGSVRSKRVIGARALQARRVCPTRNAYLCTWLE
ncbi:hypothetical protein, partial [Ralstonia solanacearum]